MRQPTPLRQAPTACNFRGVATVGRGVGLAQNLQGFGAANPGCQTARHRPDL